MTHAGDRSRPSLLDAIHHEPLRERVASVIREAIFDGSLHPGAPLVEKTIAEDLQISRAPVREAIRMLATEGLVDSVSYKGSTVRRLSERDVQEVYAMRRLLERYAVRQVIERGVDVSRDGLEGATFAMEAAASSGDIATLNEADERFHRQLIELADHELLLGMWTLLALRARHAIALRNVQIGDPAAVAANHRAIVDAIAAGDLERSLDLVSEHIDSGAQLALDD
ncbi:GntR family transcriptional regulator [soil metagenome]